MNTRQLIKGTLNTLILKLLLDNGQMYGYEIIQKLKVASADAISISEGALYPALHKLETDGYLSAERREVSGRTRKYYSLSPKGKRACQSSSAQLEQFMQAVAGILNLKTA